jgi:hypothetical protein
MNCHHNLSAPNYTDYRLVGAANNPLLKDRNSIFRFQMSPLAGDELLIGQIRCLSSNGPIAALNSRQFSR